MNILFLKKAEMVCFRDIKVGDLFWKALGSFYIKVAPDKAFDLKESNLYTMADDVPVFPEDDFVLVHKSLLSDKKEECEPYERECN